MDPKVKKFLIEKKGLKKDATDEEAEKFMKDENIAVIDCKDKPKDGPEDPRGDEVMNAVKDEIKITKDELNTRLDGVEQKLATIATDIKENVEDDPKCGYANHIEFFKDIIQAGIDGKPSEKLLKAQEILKRKNTVGGDEAKVSNNPDGGFLIPPTFMPGVMVTDPQALQADTGKLTRNIPMDTSVVYINARVDKNHSSSVSGGFRIYRREEAATVTPSKVQFEQIKFEANSLMGIAFATEEILTRSPSSFAALIQTGFDDERISKLNYERLWGTGVGEFVGIMNSPAVISVDKEGSQTADTIVGANITKMRARIWGYNNAVWMVNQDCYQQLISLHITGTKTDVFLFNPARGIDIPDTLLGRPVMFDENMATLGDKGDIALINWREYLEGQLGGSSFQESIHVRFVNNERAFRFVIYNAGAPWWRSALTPKKSSTTLSPFVTLAVRG